MQTLAFLDALWEGKTATAAIQLWRKTDGYNYTFDRTEAAADWAINNADRGDLYMAAGLAPKMARQSKNRITAAEVAGIPGLWADVDINGGPNMKTNAAPSLDVAHEVAASVLVPTVLVHSGYGLQAWWLLEEPWTFADAGERERAAQVSIAFAMAMKDRAAERQITLDSTHDLARLMRLPGTLNHKGVPPGVPAPVTLLEADGPRYSLQALAECGEEFMREAGDRARNSRGDADIGLPGTVSADLLERITDLRDGNDDFRLAWTQDAKGAARKSWSQSNWDLAIASHCVNAGFTDQEIADTIAYYRTRFGDPQGKSGRMDYLVRTISRARGGDRRTAAEAERSFEQEDAMEQLVEVAHNPVIGRESTISLFNQYLRGPEIKELIQNGRDPDTCRYQLILADGTEVPLGGPSTLLNQERFRERLVAVCQFLPPRVKGDKWDKIVQSLIRAVVVREDAEDTRAARALAWVESYVERRMSDDMHGACHGMDPFVHNDDIHVMLTPLTQWLRKMRQERLTETDLKIMLQVAGFERRTISYTRPDGKRSSRSYYVAPISFLRAHEGVAEEAA